MKRIFILALAIALTAALFAGCGQRPATNTTPPSSADTAPSETLTTEKISVVATIFPPYDFTRTVAGDKADVTMLLPPAAESHSFEPTPQDVIKIQNCDVFIYNGGDSDAWVDDVLSSIDTSNMKIVKFIDCVEVVEEEIVEGMEDDEHDHDHDHEEEEEFTIEDVKDRALTDWEGDWQSVYPYLLDGALEPVMEHKAESGEQTAQEYYEYYKTAYETAIERVVITAESMTYYISGVPVTAQYAYKGTGIITEDDESLWVRYKFEALGNPPEGAPKYVMFSDHLHAPEKTEHFHLYASDTGFDALMADTNPVNFPTYYPAELTEDEIVAEMIGHEHEEEAEIDEHVWTSPRNAKIVAQRISDALCEADAANADTYRANTAAYLNKLDDLDSQFQAVVDTAARKTIVFGDRFPFRYFADAYGLDYFAAFPGCSTETEPSAATVAFLIDKVKTERIPVVFHIELGNGKIASTIAEDTGAKVLELHACHNISRDDFQAGKTYLDLMTANVGILKEALN
jgi:zinc transport system substrate-binding protein